MSTHAKTAKAVRTELKQNWPNVKFKVASRSFANGNSVDIGVPRGFIQRDVLCELVRKYQYGTTDAMTDSYDMSNVRNDIPQVKFVSVFEYV
jgi:hypothetical protein